MGNRARGVAYFDRALQHSAVPNRGKITQIFEFAEKSIQQACP
jgi:hypothetical protein